MNKSQEVIDNETKYIAATYKPIPAVLTRAEGVYVWDIEGNKYLDMMSAYSAISVGHSHPRIIKALTEQMKKVSVVSRAFYTDGLGSFMEKLCKISGLDMAIPMNTGAEAVETAIKAARQWAYLVKKVPKNKAEIIVAKDNFHGRTTSIISFSSEEEYRNNFGPFTPGFKIVSFDDIKEIEAAITPNTCAVLMEPIQGEAGIKIPRKGFLSDLRKLCTEKNILMVMDEVQSGLGRTGKMFAFQHENAKPDILILGKALGGGILPVSATLGTKEVMELFKPGSHGSTFGGNPLACAVGLEALNVLEEEGMVENSASLGKYLLKRFNDIKSPLIREVRGKGLWVGVDFDPEKASARTICEKMMERGILSKETHETVVRFAPPLMITKEQLDEAVNVFEEIVKELEKEVLQKAG